MLKENMQNGVLTISISGKVDSSNANEIENGINAILSKYSDFTLILDLAELLYVSSAGLRVILKLRKLFDNLQLINASSEVYDIFDMTGMTEMIDIKKAFRTVSVDGCEIIGVGSNGTVYRLDSDTIIKIYASPDSLPDIQRERDLARKAFVLGIPTAISYDVVKVGNCYGSVFELLDATSFSKLISTQPEKLDYYVETYVSIMKKLHSTVVRPTDMPNMKETGIKWAKFVQEYLPKEQGDKLVCLVESIPERLTMIHGDFHTNNIMMQGEEALIIDMDTLCYGHPIFELASMYMGFRGFGEINPKSTEEFIHVTYETAGKIWYSALKFYLGTDDTARIKEVENKAMVIAYTRLMRRTIRRNGFETENGKQVIENCRKHLAEVLPTLETLDF